MRTNSEIVGDHYAAAAKGDLEGMLADLAPDARWTESEGFPLAGTYIGTKEIIANVFARMPELWTDFRFELDRLIAAEDLVVALGAYRGVSVSTGLLLDARAVHVWTVREGVLISFEQICDTEVAARTQIAPP